MRPDETMSVDNLQPIRVLVVEDREDDFDFLSHVFGQTRLGAYDLEWASTFEDGRAALQRGGHDVALFDYNLGPATGVELLQEAQAMGTTMPILLLTGHDSPEVDEAALRAGAVDFLGKAHLDHVQLERAIRYALHHAEMRAKLRQSQEQLELFMRSVPCAVAIRDEDGRTIFQNELFARFFRPGQEVQKFSADPFESVANGEPRPCVSGDRHWLVNSFPMVGSDRRRLNGFTAVDVTERVNAENERRRTTQLLDSIMQSLPVIAGRLDAGGRVVEARGRGLEHAGVQPGDLIGRVFAQVYPDARDAVREALAGESANFTLGGRRHGTEWHAEFFVTFDAAQGEGATFFGRDISARRWLERRLLTVTDVEQQRIGADLHDGLGQQLTGLSCMAAALRDRLKKSQPDEAAPAEMISQLANDAIAQSRALARGLCPVQLENAGLVIALEELAGQAHTLHAIDCRFTLHGEPPACDHLGAMHLYRITQEAIHNAVRHGKAKHVRVSLSARGPEHRLVISDDGAGFETGAHHRAPGGGLRLMGYRAAMLGGGFSVESRPGHGTRITCTFTTFAQPHENDETGKPSAPKNFEVAC
ncbi:MAG: multi-sensor signal transduction histidine kinase [Lacunisphaera sp.]|nr:multi-sensor signal transduction histidine kinase [Lacunisphaera sp.]